MIDLLPCPFCGCRAEVANCNVSLGSRVWCSGCKAYGPYGGISTRYAQNSWNVRYKQHQDKPAPKRLIAMLERYIGGGTHPWTVFLDKTPAAYFQDESLAIQFIQNLGLDVTYGCMYEGHKMMAEWDANKAWQRAGVPQ